MTLCGINCCCTRAGMIVVRVLLFEKCSHGFSSKCVTLCGSCGMVP